MSDWDEDEALTPITPNDWQGGMGNQALKNGVIGETIYDELSDCIIQKIHGIEEVRNQVTSGS